MVNSDGLLILLTSMFMVMVGIVLLFISRDIMKIEADSQNDEQEQGQSDGQNVDRS